MAVHYDVPAGQTLVIAGPAGVKVNGGEMPMVVTDAGDVQAAAPVLSALTPNTAVSGDPDLVLVISGTGFDANSIIVFGDYDEPTTFNEDGTVSTGVKPSLFAPATVPVAVRNGPAKSTSLDFTFTDPAAAGTEGAPTRKRKVS